MQNKQLLAEVQDELTTELERILITNVKDEKLLKQLQLDIRSYLDYELVDAIAETYEYYAEERYNEGYSEGYDDGYADAEEEYSDV